ncbi:restriction endonuclease subunit S [Billgrantia desiderata]|uniref:restriction endonuclease subunit S n=1 Tax=Billgrantia desiderata TaxID=52021 RepID=UPI003F3BD5CA
MAGEWTTSELGDLTINFDGKRKPVKESDRRPGPYPYYGASGVVDHVDGFLFDGDYLLIAEDGENLRTRQTPIAFMAKGKFWVNNHAHIVTGNDKADTRFLMYALQNADISGYLTGAVMPKLTQGNLNRIEISHPCVIEQRAIAHILGTLDDKIELNRRRSQTLEAMARALFKDWFVDFGPVRAKLEGRQAYLPADLWQLFPDRLDDEGKPEGWETTTLANFARLNPESWTKKSAPHEIRYVDLSNTKQGTIEGVARMPWSEAPSRAQRILRTGDTIVGTVRPGNKSFALIGYEGMTGSTGFAVLRPLEKHCRDFVFLAATSPENIERLTHLADGAAYPAVRPDVVLASPVTVPPGEIVNDVLRGFANAVSGWVDAVEKNKQESKTLAQLRDTLLPKLISGELRIKDAERFMEGASA